MKKKTRRSPASVCYSRKSLSAGRKHPSALLVIFYKDATKKKHQQGKTQKYNAGGNGKDKDNVGSKKGQGWPPKLLFASGEAGESS